MIELVVLQEVASREAILKCLQENPKIGISRIVKFTGFEWKETEEIVGELLRDELINEEVVIITDPLTRYDHWNTVYFVSNSY